MLGAFSMSLPNISLEFFPPKNENMEIKLWENLNMLKSLHPRFVSVTYGAGGSTRERTHKTVERILKETDLIPAAHITCVDASHEQVDEVLQSYWNVGVRNIVALRGDPTTGVGTEFVANTDGYKNATEVVEAAKRIGDFQISVSFYPEKHPESPSIEHDIRVLKEKIAKGANQAIGQFFVEPKTYLKFRDLAVKNDINIPLLPGMMPVGNFTGFMKMAKACNTDVPQWFIDKFDGLDDNPTERNKVAAEVLVNSVLELQREGIDNFHFYTLNRAKMTLHAAQALGFEVDQIPAE